MVKILYVRVSTITQNEDRQVQEADNYDKVFLDKCSGKDVNTPALQEMPSYVRDGDEVYVHELSRLGRNTFDLLKLVRTLLDKSVSVHFIKENLHFNPDKADPVSNMTFEIFSAVASFERQLINQRCQEGRVLAKAAGKYKGSKKHLSNEQIAELKELVAQNRKVWTPTALAKRYSICRASVYNYLKM